jgi:hypothetical protein
VLADAADTTSPEGDEIAEEVEAVHLATDEVSDPVGSDTTIDDADDDATTDQPGVRR